MPVLDPEEEAVVDEPFYGEDEYPAELEEVSQEDSLSEAAEGEETGEKPVEAQAEAEPTQEEEQPSPEFEKERELNLLRDQVQFLMQEKRGGAPNISKLQEEVNQPFKFALPENLESAKEVSDEFKAIAKDDPATIRVMGEMLNLMLNQYGQYSDKVGQANQTLQQYHSEQHRILSDELGKQGIDISFSDPNSNPDIAKMLEDPIYQKRATEYDTLYGLQSPRFYTNLHADFVEWGNKNNIQVAQGKKQELAQKAANAPQKPSGARVTPKSKQQGDDEFFAKVSKYQGRV